MTTGIIDRGHRRAWRRTIAAKLLIAFAVIAAMTAVAGLLAGLQFARIETAMGKFTNENLPAVKHSLAVESNARAVAASGAELAAATSELQRFSRMSEATDRISKLWAALTQLRTVMGDNGATETL